MKGPRVLVVDDEPQIQRLLIARETLLPRRIEEPATAAV